MRDGHAVNAAPTTATWTAAQLHEQLEHRLPSLLRRLSLPLFYLFGVREALRILKRLEGLTGRQFVTRALQELSISYEVLPHTERPLDLSGPLLIVCNHHLGGVDALVLMDYVLSLRPDARLLANRFLTVLPPLHELVIPVHPLSSRRRNSDGKSIAEAHLAAGGCLLVFPAAQVASFSIRFGVVDLPWRWGTGDLVLSTGCAAVPTAIFGRNTMSFYGLRRLSFKLSSLLLLRQLLAQRGVHLTLHVGDRIDPGSFERHSAPQVVRELRDRVYGMRDQDQAKQGRGGRVGSA